MKTQQFSLTPADVDALQAAAARRSTAVRIARWTQLLTRIAYALVALFALGYALLKRANVTDEDDRTRWLLVAFAVVAFFFVGSMLTVLSGYRARRTHLELGRDLAYELTDDGVRIHHPRGAAVTPWSELDGVERTPGHVVLYLKGGGATVIPRRAFASDAEADAFAQAARERVDPAR